MIFNPLRTLNHQRLNRRMMRLSVLLLITSACLAVSINSDPFLLSLTAIAEPQDGTGSMTPPPLTSDEIGMTIDFPEITTGVVVVSGSDPRPSTEGNVIGFNNGRVLRAARIITIGETFMIVAHAEGMSGVPIESVPQDFLKRARAVISAGEAERLREEAESAARRAVESQGLLGTLEARINAVISDRASLPVRQAMNPQEQLQVLKEKFPRRTRGRNNVGIEFDIPSREVWAFFYSTFEATSLETLSATLAVMETRLSQNVESWQVRSKFTESLPQSVEHLQAERTVLWLSRTLRAFLAEARQLAL